MLRKRIDIFRPVLTRLLETCATNKPTYILECLNDRELVRVSGDDAMPFLQGLITNDMSHFVSSQLTSMYSMILNKTGRLLYDTIIYRTTEGNTYLLECDKRIAADLKRHLRVYRVRRRVNVDSVENILKPWVIFRPDDSEPKIEFNHLSSDMIISPDPRVKSLGIRLLTSSDKNWNEVAKLFCKPREMIVEVPKCEYNYRVHLYKNGVGEGIIDHPPGKCFPLESNGDFLHGISFNKGCYIGQELTARVYHTGMVRKRLMPLKISVPVPDSINIVQTLAGLNIGVIRGVSYNRCIALLRLEQALSTNTLMIDGDACSSSKPNWWPKELPKKACTREN